VVIEVTNQKAQEAAAERPAVDGAGDDAAHDASPEAEPRAARGRRAPKVGPPAPGPVSIVLAFVMAASVAAAFFGAFAFGLGGLQEQRNQHELYASLRGLLDPASPVAPPIGGRIPEGSPVALLNAPAAGLRDAVVVEGTSSGDLLSGPGHLADTPLPGQAGNAVLLGKAATAGAPFARISHLHRGDVVRARTGQGLFRYRVQGRLLDGGRLPAIPSTSGFLVLGTAAGPGGLASIAPSRVLYVFARLEGQAVPAPKGRPHHVPTSQLPGQGDPAAWPFVALWGLALLAATGACWWLWSFWGLLRTWIVAAPVFLGILWALSEEALRLLPNVY
jgi:sortase A